MKGVEQRRKLLSKERWRKGKDEIPRESNFSRNFSRDKTHIPSYNMKFRGLSLRANYTDRATAACRRSWCQRLRIDGVS
jgi:hypothetical protein